PRHRPLVAEREVEGGQQCLGFLVSLGAGGDADVHTTDSVDLVVFDFGKDDLFLHTDVVVATAIESTTGHTTEVTHTGQGHGDETIKKLVHTTAAQRDHAADGVVFADLEACDGLLGLGDDRLLAGDLGHIANSVLDDFLVSDRFRHTHVEGDLGNAGHFHHALVAKLGLQVGDDLAVIKLLQTSHVLLPLTPSRQRLRRCCGIHGPSCRRPLECQRDRPCPFPGCRARHWKYGWAWSCR